MAYTSKLDYQVLNYLKNCCWRLLEYNIEKPQILTRAGPGHFRVHMLSTSNPSVQEYKPAYIYSGSGQTLATQTGPSQTPDARHV